MRKGRGEAIGDLVRDHNRTIIHPRHRHQLVPQPHKLRRPRCKRAGNVGPIALGPEIRSDAIDDNETDVMSR